MKVVKPSQSLLEGKPYTPSFLMSWKPTLIPKLQGHYGPTGFYQLKVEEGTLSYERGSGPPQDFLDALKFNVAKRGL